jgi:hypothetical protein
MLRVPAVRPRRSPASSAQAVSPANSACYEPSVRMSMTHRFLRRRSRSSSSPLRKMAAFAGRAEGANASKGISCTSAR